MGSPGVFRVAISLTAFGSEGYSDMLFRSSRFLTSIAAGS